MDCRTRSIATRCRLAAAALILLICAAGCGGHSNVQVTSQSGPSGGVSLSAGSYQRSIVSDLIVIGVMLGLYHASETEVPSADPTRRVAEQDCTRPIEDTSANLKCR